jgi:hypothetical protein
VLQEVHLPEEVLLLLLGQERLLVERRQLRRHVLGHLHRPALLVKLLLARHRRQNLGLLGRVVKGGVVNVVERLVQQAFRPHLVNHSVDAGPGPPELIG